MSVVCGAEKLTNKKPAEAKTEAKAEEKAEPKKRNAKKG